MTLQELGASQCEKTPSKVATFWCNVVKTPGEIDIGSVRIHILLGVFLHLQVWTHIFPSVC